MDINDYEFVLMMNVFTHDDKNITYKAELIMVELCPPDKNDNVGIAQNVPISDYGYDQVFVSQTQALVKPGYLRKCEGCFGYVQYPQFTIVEATIADTPANATKALQELGFEDYDIKKKKKKPERESFDD